MASKRVVDTEASSESAAPSLPKTKVYRVWAHGSLLMGDREYGPGAIVNVPPELLDNLLALGTVVGSEE